MDCQIDRLSNGMGLVHIPVNSVIAHCGVFINAGSRDETDAEHGLAHFIEHAMFKGTSKRKSYHIISRLEDVGGDINAYTSKEETCVHASFLKEYYPRTIELISDILFHSTYPEKELEKEKDIIIDEINSYFDSPSELIFDDFEELLFAGNPMGRSILGKPENIRAFQPVHIQQFINKHYHPADMVFCSAGDISFGRLKAMLERHFDHSGLRGRNAVRHDTYHYEPKTVRKGKDTFQSHCIIGNVAYGLQDERRVGLYLLSNILGGPGMNTRLNMSLRERHGCSYSVEASFNPYTDCGSLAIYFGTDKQNLDRSIQLTHKEFDLVRTKKLGTLQLSKARKQLIGQLAIASENNESMMLNAGKSMMVYDRVDSLEQMYAKINEVTASELLDIANEVLNPGSLSMLIFE